MSFEYALSLSKTTTLHTVSFGCLDDLDQLRNVFQTEDVGRQMVKCYSPIRGRAPNQPYFGSLLSQNISVVFCRGILFFRFLFPSLFPFDFVLQSFSSALSSRIFVGRAQIGEIME